MRLNERFFEGFFKKSRLKDYKDIIASAYEAAYKMYSVRGYGHLVAYGQEPTGKVLINRHDVDSSCKVERMMFDIDEAFIILKNPRGGYIIFQKMHI